MSWTDDPLADFYQHDHEQAEREARRPICAGCGEHILDDVAYKIAGRLYCESCIDDARVYLEE